MLKTEAIRSTDEGDEKDKIPEGFHLQVESPHCLNMKRSKSFQAYLRQIVLEFEQPLKAGGTDMRDAYAKIIDSFYWACMANKNTINGDVDREQVLQSIRDPKCKAWKMKLKGKKMIDPTTLVDDDVIAPQKASQIISMKPNKVWELVEEEMVNKSPEQVKMMKDMIKVLLRSQSLAHRHAVDHLMVLSDMMSIPGLLQVMNATLCPVVAVKIPEVDNMLEEAQKKVEAIQQAKLACQGQQPIDEVIFAQNCPTYNPEWQHAKEGKATSYLVMIICRFMDELMWKDTHQVLSARALETIYHTASSWVGKLISGKHYLGGYVLDQLIDKMEVEGKDSPLVSIEHQSPRRPCDISHERTHVNIVVPPLYHSL